jgi:hypothetical protein
VHLVPGEDSRGVLEQARDRRRESGGQAGVMMDLERVAGHQLERAGGVPPLGPERTVEALRQ